MRKKTGNRNRIKRFLEGKKNTLDWSQLGIHAFEGIVYSQKLVREGTSTAKIEHLVITKIVSNNH